MSILPFRRMLICDYRALNTRKFTNLYLFFLLLADLTPPPTGHYCMEGSNNATLCKSGTFQVLKKLNCQIQADHD